MIELTVQWISALVAGLIGLVVGWLVGGLGKRRQRIRLEQQLARRAVQAKEQSRALVRSNNDQGLVATLARSLPAVVRELNRADLNPRHVPRLILSLAETIFHPKQILFYGAVPGEAPGSKELRLIEHTGLRDVPASLQRIPFGRGKIGWVAAHQLDMVRDDWTNLVSSEGTTVENDHPTLQADIVGPLLRQDGRGVHTLGVLCLGSPGVRPRNEKLLFQLVANLGSLAVVNSQNVHRLRELANTDGLTGLVTKRYFLQQLTDLLQGSGPQAQRLSLFIFDIDHFKNYNDTNGHPAGDDLLRTLSRLIKSQARPGDWYARYGGEEFIVAMPETNRQEAMNAAERIRCLIEEHHFPNQEKQPSGNVTISGGVAVFPDDGATSEELIQHADEALYESKRHGRNRVCRYRGIDMGHDSFETDMQGVGEDGAGTPT